MKLSMPGYSQQFVLRTYVTVLDYLYRVESYHVGTTGSAKSAWIATRSGQGGE